MQEWQQSFDSIQAAHEEVQQSGQKAVLSTSRLGQDLIGHALRDLAAQLASVDDDARRLESSLSLSLRTYREFDQTLLALTEWLADMESHLEQLNTIDFFASENLEDDCKVLLLFKSVIELLNFSC